MTFPARPGFAPLIDEARRRARRRWFLYGAAVLAALALTAGAFFAGRGGGASPGGGAAGKVSGGSNVGYSPGPVRFLRTVTLPPGTAPLAVRQAFAARRYAAAPPREAARVHSPRGPMTLWASPAYGGGWCEGLQEPRQEFNRMSVSCIWPHAWMRRRIDVTGYLPRLYWGRVPQRGVRSVRLRLGDRGSLSVPTRDGFFQFRVPDSVLAHTDPSGLRALDAQGRVVASEKLFAPFPEGLAFGGIARPPGGAALAQKHELVLRPTPAGPASIWAAPSSVAPARCTWLQIGLAVYGGGCRRYQTPGRGLSEAVPLRLRVKGKALRVLWGQAGSDVARLEVLFQDGSKTSLPLTDGVFLYPIPDSRWSAGHRPAFLVARDRGGHTLAKRLLYEFTLAPA